MPAKYIANEAASERTEQSAGETSSARAAHLWEPARPTVLTFDGLCPAHRADHSPNDRAAKPEAAFARLCSARDLKQFYIRSRERTPRTVTRAEGEGVSGDGGDDALLSR